MKIKFLILLLFISSYAISQEFYGKAIYRTSSKVKAKIDTTVSNYKEKEKAINAIMQKRYQKKYILRFNRYESIYKEDEKLKSPSQSSISAGNTMVASVAKGTKSGITYRNLKENRMTMRTEAFGKLFLIKDPLSKIDWELTGETKSIGNYTCYEAKYTRKEDGLLVTAWYTPQIPISTGPDKFWGLPGLILEIRYGKGTIILCTEIELNPDNKVKIIEPTRGKKITGVKFNEMYAIKYKELERKGF